MIIFAFTCLLERCWEYSWKIVLMLYLLLEVELTTIRNKLSLIGWGKMVILVSL